MSSLSCENWDFIFSENKLVHKKIYDLAHSDLRQKLGLLLQTDKRDYEN